MLSSKPHLVRGGNGVEKIRETELQTPELSEYAMGHVSKMAVLCPLEQSTWGAKS